ncbi:MAG: SMI1/KNR4 family protein [Alphaproteobacteria bacterium]|nr:SMI1/KNR4 family protein [Alphaproteobacteria bacterium]
MTFHNLFKTKCEHNIDTISIIENFLNYKLPSDYKKFLIEINGGVPLKKYFIYNQTGSSLKCFFGINKHKDFNLIKFYNDYKDIIPSDIIPIGQDEGGNILLLAVSGKNYGCIFYLDHDQPIQIIANSFDEFLSMLKSEDEIDALLNEEEKTP